MTVRTDVADLLTTKLPDYRVIPYGRQVDGVNQRTVLVEVSRYEATTTATAVRWTADVSLYVLSEHLEPQAAEDDLDEAINEVLGVVDQLPWTAATAERVVIQDNLQAYQITLTFQLKELD